MTTIPTTPMEVMDHKVKQIIINDYVKTTESLTGNEAVYNRLSNVMATISSIMMGLSTIFAFSSGFFSNIYISYAAGITSVSAMIFMKISTYANDQGQYSDAKLKSHLSKNYRFVHDFVNNPMSNDLIIPPLPTQPLPTQLLSTQPLPTQPLPTQPLPTQPLSTQPPQLQLQQQQQIQLLSPPPILSSINRIPQRNDSFPVVPKMPLQPQHGQLMKNGAELNDEIDNMTATADVEAGADDSDSDPIEDEKFKASLNIDMSEIDV